MACFRLFLVAFLATCAAAATASAAEWPLERQFPLVEPPPPVHAYPPPTSVVEDTDGSLLVLVYWPTLLRTSTGESEYPHTSLVRIAADGSRAFIPPFGAPEPKFPRIEQVDDEILPLRDGSILFTRSNGIYRLRPNGSIERFAATGRSVPHGLTRFPDGSIVFADGPVVRRVGRNGKITTIAGNGEFGYSGDGGPATEAPLARPEDVLPEKGGGFLIAEKGSNRVRRVSPDGVISTIAGTGAPDPFGNAVFEGTGDGGPATAAGLALPAHLGRLPDGSLLIGEWSDIRRVAPDGTISTIFHAAQAYGDRLGDFAGRFGDTIEAMDTTREGGIAVITAGYRLRAFYLAPRHTRRTLVALRGTRVSGRRVEAIVDATTPGLLRLTVRRGGKLVASAVRRVPAGRSTIGVGGRFAAADHKLRVKLRADRGGAYGDHLHVYTSDSLPKRLVTTDPRTRCERIDRRRIDCEAHYEEDEEDGIPCLYTVAHRLFRSGLTFARPYGPGCHDKPIPFERNPHWTGPWRAIPPR